MNIEKNKVYIIGCGSCGDENLDNDSLSHYACSVIDNATVILSSKRILRSLEINDILKQSKNKKKLILLQKNITETLEKWLSNENIANENIVILGSGDVLFNGIANSVLKLIDSTKIAVIPNITAFQDLCAKVNFDWSNAQLISIHGVDNEQIPWLNILDGNAKIIYCDNKCTASDFAEKLIENYPAAASRNAIAAENLGLINQKIVITNIANVAKERLSGLSIMLLAEEHNSQHKTVLPLGIDDKEFFYQNNLITHNEVRAVAISKLNLKLYNTMWDLGAGSGSVGIEAKLLCQNKLKLFLVEKNSERCRNIKNNIYKFGANFDNEAKILNSDILECIDKLPTPDSVYIGGGGKDVVEIIEKTFEKLAANGTIVVATVTIESMARVATTLSNCLVEVVALNIAKNKKIGIGESSLNMMKALNPIHLFVFKKIK
ncbi:precorrin-6y C5,15-methyltransferase (decarboxylating) subunit CbiE [Lentisphaerota bacterium WC36G]|nr:precorrin-6y C5,15-methyltransferase (decarboxylating) subunit CbiE [Lentisphaerae bacterium WC36]